MALACELDGVCQKIGENLANSQRIAQKHPGIAEQMRMFYIKKKMYAFFRGPLANQQHRMGKNILQPEFNSFQAEFSGLNLGKIQNIIDDSQKRLRRLLDFMHIIPLVFIQIGFERKIGHTDNCVHRGSDLVAHIGQKERLGPG